MEINPFIELREENKICPPESWGNGDILCTDGVANPPLRLLINQSRQSDIQDAEAKVAICSSLRMNVASWKGDGLVVYLPDRVALLAAIRESDKNSVDFECRWQVRTSNADLRQQLLDAEIPLAHDDSSDYLYQSL
jgi:hypothetical protein